MRNVVLALLATIAGEVTSRSLDVVVGVIAGNAPHVDTVFLDARRRLTRDVPQLEMFFATATLKRSRHRGFTCHAELWRGLRIASPKL